MTVCAAATELETDSWASALEVLAAVPAWWARRARLAGLPPEWRSWKRALPHPPVVYVHGFDLTAPGESNCRGVWGDRDRGFIGRIVDWGHRGPQQRVKYYREDTECTLDLHHHGKHRRHHSSGHRRGGHTVRTSIRHLGYHFAWQIWAHYTKRGQRVNVVAHSMGGLIVRYALARVHRDHRRFPPRLSIANVITLGTPHKGAPLAAFCDITEHRQCNQLDPRSGFIRWLRRHAKNPQGHGGTDWTVVGSRYVDFRPPTPTASCPPRPPWGCERGTRSSTSSRTRSITRATTGISRSGATRTSAGGTVAVTGTGGTTRRTGPAGLSTPSAAGAGSGGSHLTGR